MIDESVVRSEPPDTGTSPPGASGEIAPPTPVAMPPGTPPWMWLARESLPYLSRIVLAVARLLLALAVGAAALLAIARGQSLPAELLRVLAGIVHGGP